MCSSRALALTLGLCAAPALAGGQEGAAYVIVIVWMVGITLATFVASMIGGAIHGARKAARGGEPVLGGIGLGLLRGLGVFAAICIAAAVLLTILGFVWVAYSLFVVHVLGWYSE